MKRFLYLLPLVSFALASCSKEVETPAPPPTPTYKLSFSAEEGGTVSTEGGTYNQGSKITVTATPDGQYLFKEWSDGSTVNPREITVNSDLTLKATFVKKTYPLSVTIDGEGTVQEQVIIQGSTAETQYNAGTTVRLTATPNEGWVFSGWTGDIESADLVVEVPIEKGTSVSALFKRDSFELNITIEGEGTVKEEVIVQPSKYDFETVVRLTAVPADWWEFSGWSNGSTENPLELTVVSVLNIQAIFTKKQIENYFSINVIGNGTYQRSKSPYPPLDYNIELISGNKGENGDYSKGSIIRLSVKENPGWQIDYSLQINQPKLNEDIIVEDNLEFKLDVRTTSSTFPFNELNSDGTFLNVGSNIGAYAEWNEPNSELNYYISENFMYPDYIETYKDRMYEIRQLIGEWGPLDILIHDHEQSPVKNREMFLKTREARGARAYENQLISNIQNWVDMEMERYDKIMLEGGYPFGSADAPMGTGKQIGLIKKNKNWEYLETFWGPMVGLGVADLVNSEGFNWEWETGAYHEYIHIWQGSQNKHGFINDISTCFDCNAWTARDPNLNTTWVAPRWFQEGQCHVIQSILSEKMEIRAEQNRCCSPPRPIFNVRNYLEQTLLGQAETGQNPDRLERLQKGSYVDGYWLLGDIASWYKFAKMNYSLETYMAFETHRGTYGYASALQTYLGMSEDEFYTTFNNWFFDSNLSKKEKLDYLYPEGTNPIQKNILKRR